MNWDKYFLDIAEMVSKRSHCLKEKNGAVLVSPENQIVSTGYCGPPRGYPHCEACKRLESEHGVGYDKDRCPSIHAEMNVIVQAARYGISTNGCTMYVQRFPCTNCARMMKNAGIAKIIYPESTYLLSDSEFVLDLLQGIEVKPVVWNSGR